MIQGNGQGRGAVKGQSVGTWEISRWEGQAVVAAVSVRRSPSGEPKAGMWREEEAVGDSPVLTRSEEHHTL